MKAREPSSLLRLRSSFVVIPSGRSIYIYIYIYIPPAGFSYLRGEENGELGCGDGSGGGGKGRR